MLKYLRKNEECCKKEYEISKSFLNIGQCNRRTILYRPLSTFMEYIIPL